MNFLGSSPWASGIALDALAFGFAAADERGEADVRPRFFADSDGAVSQALLTVFTASLQPGRSSPHGFCFATHLLPQPSYGT